MRTPSIASRRRKRGAFSGGNFAASGTRLAMKTSHEFVLEHAGSLPEAVAEGDLDTLNSGLRFLFADLRSAQRLYHEEGDNGRAGTSAALGAVWRFVVLFKVPLAETLHVPILNLHSSLQGLENNLVEPILKPVPRLGRAPSSDARAALKGCVAGTVERISRTGLSRQDANLAVAEQLRELGVRPERGLGDVTDDTVRHWCDEVATDVGRHGTAANVYDSMFTPAEVDRFSALPLDQARSRALGSLADFVQAISPARLEEKPVNQSI
jgi:hypothetical protein